VDHGRAGKLLRGLERAWARTDGLFGLLAPGALAAQPIALRQPFIFYLGHLPAFAWNQVCRGVLGWPSIEPAFDELFARGIDPMEADGFRPPPPDAWPPEDAVVAYRDRVRDALRGACEELDARARTDADVLVREARIGSVALEHELMHHETFLYMVQQLPPALKRPPPGLPSFAHDGAAEPATVDVPAGRFRLGADFGSLPFGWDNEFGRAEVEVEAFTIDATPVRNSEFFEFVEDAGYARRELWSHADWSWRESHAMTHPVMWRPAGRGWMQQTLFEDVPLDRVGDWPVYVSWAEASAFSRWRGARLPTEAEWHWAAYGTRGGALLSYPWGEDPGEARHGNFGLRQWSPMPVGRFPQGASAWGVLDLVGNGWEWTATPFGPLPGFTPYIRTYPGYSADFFDGRHYVLRGASWATDETLIRRSFRNWFQPHYPYVFAKFRLIRTPESSQTTNQHWSPAASARTID
jgi:ergothioneine biosynthesis protein EgtB